MKIGDVSGCLEVISSIKDAECEIKDIVRGWAEKWWNKFDKNYDVSFYGMDKKEAVLFNAKKAMPESFVGKYRKSSREVLWSDLFLSHKVKPNTREDLLRAFWEGKLFKVKCNICNRTFYMDEVSFKRVKWQSCIGAECLKNTIKDVNIDYLHSMYEWDKGSNALQTVNYQLAKVEALSTPLTYYGLEEILHIAYISDIHLLHHLHFYAGNHKRMVNDMTKKLYESMGKVDIVIFGGDTSSDSALTIYFYKQFMRRYNYEQFKAFKKELSRFKEFKKKLSSRSDSTLIQRREKIDKYLDERKKALPEFYAALRKYKRAYYANDTYKTAWEYYKKVKSYSRFALSDSDIQHVNETLSFLDLSDRYEKEYCEEKERIWGERYELERFEKRYGKSIKKIRLSDYKHVLLEGVYAVLGNHEFIGFPDIASGVSFYEREFSKLGIKLLHNEYSLHREFLIYGGTGFAKYNAEWNADTLNCCDGFSRVDEVKETEIYEKGYENALKYAKENGLCFLCVSHYPVSDCLGGKYDKEAIYFTGHNHNNEYVKSTDKVLYADNQVGYKHNNVGFRIATTGFEINPYHSLQDGMYQTSIEDYLQFYRFIGESVGQGNALYQRCQNGRANLYVVKRKGYYGFFIVVPDGNSKGISIVNGGSTKKITGSIDMGWICENFEIVLLKYLQLLTPLRNAQKQISEELKELGFDGKIHGCIVDIDFYHHISVNPNDGSMIFYYSSMFGLKLNLPSFKEVIKSIESKDMFDNRYDYEKILEMYDKRSENKGYLLGQLSDGYLIEMVSDDLEDEFGQEEMVSRKEGMYGVSRKINPLQRLFSGHVLRDFDLRLAETKLKPYRTYLYPNRLFEYENRTYKVIEDDGSEIIIAEEVQGEVEGHPNEIVLTGKRRKFSITALKNEIAKDEWGTYWITK